MMIPSRRSCSPRSVLSSTAACAIAALASGSDHCVTVVHLHAGSRPHGTNGLVAADHDLLARLDAAQNLDIGGAGDPGFHFAEFGLLIGDNKYSGDFFLALFLGRQIEGRLAAVL